VSLPLPFRSSADTEGDVHRVMGKLEAANGAIGIMRLMANSSAAFRPFTLLTTSLLTSKHLPRTLQEIVILHLAQLRRSPYEWHEHVPMALDHGVTEEQCRSIEVRKAAMDPDLFKQSDLLAVKVATAACLDEPIKSSDWAAAVREWGQEGAFDLLLTAAVWGGMIPVVIKATGLRHAAEFAARDPR
jgi:alkylhydroperoxidase family enzyme